MDSEEKRMRAKLLIDILKNEYGITNNAELDEAIKNLKPLDISMFVSPVQKRT